MERPAFPLRQRERYLKLDVLEVPWCEGRGPFDTVQVVVESRPFRQEHRARHALEVDVGLKIVLERRLDETQGLLLL